jgi:lysophospholipase L1-like esterase
MGNNNKISLYDINKTYLGNIEGTLDATNVYRVVTLNVPNVRYIRTSFENRRLNTAMIVINKNYPSEYQPYKANKQFNDDFALNSTQKSEVQEIVSTSPTSENPLHSKISLFDGDSICAGAGWEGNTTNSGYAKVIGEANNMTWVNYGVGGGTIAAETYSGGNPRHWISRNIGNMQSEADYIILQGGINDYWLNVPLGQITSDYVSVFDDTTFSGAMESMLKQAILKWKGKKIGFIITHKIGDTYYPYGNPVSGRFENYRDKIIEICNKWSIPYLDLFTMSGLNSNIDEINDLYFKLSNGHGDRCHPNEQGYRQFLAPKIEAWMKTL